MELHKAVLEAGKLTVEPAELIEFHSAGKCLLIGKADEVAAVAPQLSSLQLFCIITDDGDVELDEDITLIKAQLQQLTGWLGAFKARFTSHELDIDLVLDLSEQPLIATKVPPLGYFAPAADKQALVEALQQLPELVGVFDKPRYFDYNADICAHGRRGVTGCSNCLDACPAAAIESGLDLINVNPSLCQGCGSCTVVCPSGAISYALPSLDTSIDRLRKMLQVYFADNQQTPQILIHDEGRGQELLQAYDYPVADSVIPFSVEEIGALGLPFWLTALAYGAGRITIWDAGSHQDHDWHELQAAIKQANVFTAGLGLGEQRIMWLSSQHINELSEHLHEAPEAMPGIAAQYAGVNDKRRMTTMALTHLHQQAADPLTVLALDDEAAFGQIAVDKKACTLCMSCVSVCPAGALLDGVDKPQLNFVEDLCVQCSMCETACPENAIQLQPRYLFDREQARQKRIMNEEPIFHCISCHKPFATQKMIDTMVGKLKDHPMFQGAALERLKMCEDCRVKAMFKDSKGPM